ncbi:hypothetical protein Taro_025960 [Colocasia esculenta]|uniref:Uncharacterized protein n=1 Tax=Colocasia esculenta TaxID=4460 RepID=A0A843VFQ9_COLES|nr:hypothetical protein [Colocasia esculenta]
MHGQRVKIYKALLEVLQLPVDSRLKAVDRRMLPRTQITGTMSFTCRQTILVCRQPAPTSQQVQSEVSAGLL